MADQLRPVPARASATGIVGRIVFALALVMCVLVAIPLLVAVFGQLWDGAGAALLVLGALGVLLLVLARLVKPRR